MIRAWLDRRRNNLGTHALRLKRLEADGAGFATTTWHHANQIEILMAENQDLRKRMAALEEDLSRLRMHGHAWD